MKYSDIKRGMRLRPWIPITSLLLALGLNAGDVCASSRITTASQAIEKELERGIREKIFESASVGWIQNGSIVAEIHVGGARPESIYDLASLSKPLFTATAVTLLSESGILKFSDPVAKFFPSWQRCAIRSTALCAWRKKIKVADLLRHQSGLTDGRAYSGDSTFPEKLASLRASGKEWRLALDATYPVREPGKSFVYQDINFITLLELARQALRTSGEVMTLEQFVEGKVLRPLSMSGTFAREVPATSATDVVPTTSGVPAGEIHDPIARKVPDLMGHAGLFARLSDLLKFSKMLLSGGRWNGQQILSPASIDGFGSGVRGLGWDAKSDFSTSLRGPFEEGFGHTGYTGTSIWVIPSSNVAWVLLTNRTYYADGSLGRGKPNTAERIKELRKFVATQIFSAQ